MFWPPTHQQDWTMTAASFLASSSRRSLGFTCFFLCNYLKSGASGYVFTRRTIVSTAAVGMSSTSTEPLFWNRELSKKQSFDAKAPIVKDANIICVGYPNDKANAELYQITERKNGAKVLKVEDSIESFDTPSLQEANVLYVSYSRNAREVVANLVKEIPSIEWIHARSAGIDFITSDDLSAWAAKESHVVTNAKGSFSSTLAEYTLLACSYL